MTLPRNKVYIATRLHNAARAQEIKEIFNALGIEITYDWTVHGQVYTEEELSAFGQEEEQGVRACDVLLMIFPGGCGSHWEAGLARGHNIPIVLLMEQEVEMKTFYYLSDGVYRTKTEDEAIKKVLNLLGRSDV